MNLARALPGLLLIATASCTIYATASLGGLGPDGGGAVNNGCRNVLTNVNACGACMEQAAGAAADQLCPQRKGSTTLVDMEDCAQKPELGSSACSTFFPASSAAISSATTPDALESNIEVLIGKSCELQCQKVSIGFSGCKGATVKLESHPCGKCMTESCQAELIKTYRSGGIPKTTLVDCGKTSDDCPTTAPTCDTIKNPGTSYTADAKALFTCIVQKCGSAGDASCPGL